MTITTSAFIACALVYMTLFVRTLWGGIAASTLAHQAKLRVRLLVGLVAWSLFVVAWSVSGRMASFSRFPFNLMPVFAPPLVASLLFCYSNVAAEIVRHIPRASLIGLQSFRVIVEILLWRLFIAGLAPEQLSFAGRNLDVLTGLSAPLVAYLSHRQLASRTALIAWNIGGLLLLANIVAIAVLSMPTPLRVFMNEPANTIVTRFPVSLLPGLLVPLAYTLHFLSLRQLGQCATASSPAR